MNPTHKIDPLVVGLTGLSGSGKTYFVNKLKEHLGDNLTIVGFDDYYKSLQEQLIDEKGEANYDLPTALYSDKFHQDLMQLIEYHPVVLKKYQYEHYDAPEVVEILSPAPILLIEGLFVMEFEPVDELLEVRFFVECDIDLCFERRLARDIAERNIPESRSRHQWNHHVLPAYEKFILPHKNRCDLVVENTGTGDDNIRKIIEIIKQKAHPTVQQLL